jgi:cob(I)alamin adenosyltransferase
VKIYTRTGDAGETGLRGGVRVRKNVLRVEAYGTVDELSAALGMVCAALPGPDLTGLLRSIQQDLFVLGAQLADARCAEAQATERAAVPETRVAELEREIDQAQENLPPLRSFVFPGGCEVGARLHLARTICRRAERRLAALAEAEPVAPVVLAYVNRLSDLLFVLARLANHRARVQELMW